MMARKVSDQTPKMVETSSVMLMLFFFFFWWDAHALFSCIDAWLKLN